MTRETSTKAHRGQREGGGLMFSQRLALSTLAALGKATARELDQAANATGLWKRLSELKAAGLVVECGIRACSVTGVAALLWRAVGDDEPLPVVASKPRRRRWFLVVADGWEALSAHDHADDADAAAGEREHGVEVIEVQEINRAHPARAADTQRERKE